MSIPKTLFLLSAGLFAAGAVMAKTIEIVAGETAYPIELLENDAAKALVERLPMRMKFEDFGATERIAYLDGKLEVGASPTSTTPQTGDLAYYMPWGNLAVFVKPFRRSEGLVPLGRLSDAALEAVKRSGDELLTLQTKQ